MGSPAYKGTITLNKPLTKDVVDKIERAFNDSGYGSYWESSLLKDLQETADEGLSEIEIDEYYSGSFDEELERIIGFMEPEGYVLNGTLNRYDGVPDDGKMYIEDNKVSEYDLPDCWKKDATTQELIEVLESRGVKVPPYVISCAILKSNKGKK